MVSSALERRTRRATCGCAPKCEGTDVAPVGLQSNPRADEDGGWATGYVQLQGIDARERALG